MNIYNNEPSNHQINQEQPTSPEIYNIPLLEEKLKVDRSKRKVGEVVIRKEIETRMVQVPVRQEKLIIERIGENPERLAEVVTNETKINGLASDRLTDTNTLHITKSHFLTVEMAQKLLREISRLSSAANAKIRLEIVTNSSDEQIEHQSICDRYH